MDWIPITRDCVVFAANVIVLIGTTWDGYIQWYEALIIMLFAIPYYVIMFQSVRISRFMKRKFEVEYGCCNRNISGAAGGKDIKAFFFDRKLISKILTVDVVDVEKKGKDNAGFKNSTTAVDQVSTVGKVEDENVDDKTVSDKDKRTEEGKITK